jgi:hypothetical protein
MEEVTARVYLVSINRSRYSAVYGGGHAKTAFLHARPSARQRISGSTVYTRRRGNPKKFQSHVLVGRVEYTHQ